MGTLLGKLCSGQANPLLSLNETCQRLRCLMACCGGNVNVITRGDADVTDASVQTDDVYEKTSHADNEEEEENKDKEDIDEDEEEEEDIDEDGETTV